MKRIFLFVFLNVWVGFLAAETDSTLVRLASFVKNIQVFNHLYPQEKVYLHFDNTGYFLGESIWFKAYVTTASMLSQTPLSRVLYVELLDTEGNVVHTQKLRITEGQADGSIPLTKLAMKSGFYEVRAYTRLMLNWDRETLFSRVFPVFDKPAHQGEYDKKIIRLRPTSYKIPQKRAETPSAGKLNVEFYPEGGYLVNGITSVVGFKVTDREGRSLSASGCVCNAQGDTLSAFSTVHEGMGSFLYTPDGGKSKIWIRNAEEKKGSSFELPSVEASGCVMQVQNLHPDQVRIHISGTSEYTSVPLGFTVMCRGKVGFFKSILLIPQEGSSFILPKSELPCGVNQLTLFTSEGKVLSERLVYIPGDSSFLKMAVRAEKEHYNPFEEVRMEVSVQDSKGNPVGTNVSLSVRDSKTEIPSSYEETACSNLLLSSDLKGYISNPSYYFAGDDKAHRLALDLLMLTQGYRRYSWQQMAGIVPFNPLHKIEKGIVVEGSVKTITKKKVQENVDVKMTMFSDSAFQRASCVTDEEGCFNYLADDFYGKWNLQLETRKNDKRKECWITLDRQFSPQGRAYSFYDMYIPEMKSSKNRKNFLLSEKNDTEDAELLLNDSLDLDELSKGAKALKEVVVKGKKNWDGVISRGVNIVYDMKEEEDKLEDQAAGYNEDVYEFLSHLNPYFTYRSEDTGIKSYYKGRKVIFEISSSISSGLGQSELGSSLLESLSGMAAENSSTSSLEIPAEDSSPASSRKNGNSTGEIDVENIGNENVEVSRLNSSDIESIAIIEDPSTYYALKPELIAPLKGKYIVLMIVKVNPNRLKAREPIGVRLTTLQGYSLPRAFYSPNYKDYQLPKEEDFRRTLYWNPNVKTNSQGKASVTFYNNGSCKAMTMSAETLTSEGLFGSYHEETE